MKELLRLVQPLRAGGLLSWGSLLLLAVSALAILALRPPEPKPEDAPRTEFSAARAATVLRRLLGSGEPHPVGTRENRELRARLELELRRLSLEPRVHAGLSCGRFGACAPVENIVVELPAAKGGPALGIAVHYDSVAAGPGAADDGAGVASAIEIARALMSAGPLPRPVWLLFTDGEEAGLLGAEHLAREGALTGRFELVLNLEARGVSGPSLLFQTSERNLALVRTFAESTERPVASSLFAAVYRLLPNDTDLSVFVREGAAGLNFAFIEGARHYHGPSDDLAHLSLASVQHQGDQALAVARAYLRGAPLQSSEDAIFFDVLARFVVSYSRTSAVPALAGACAALVILLGFCLRRGLISVSGVASACFTWTGATALALIWALVFQGLLHGQVASDQPWPERAWLLLIAAHAGAFAALLGASAAAGRAIDVPNAFFGAAAGTLVLTLILTHEVPEAQFVGLVPSSATLALGAAALALDPRRGLAAAALCAIVPAALVCAPIGALTYHALGLALPAVTPCIAALALTPLFPLLAGISPRARALGCAGCAVVAFACVGAWRLLPAYGPEAPARASLSHHTDADSGRTRWLLDAAEVPAALAALAPFAPAEPLPGLRPSSARFFEAPAPRVEAALPELMGSRKPAQHGHQNVSLTIRATPGALRVTLWLPGGSVRELSIENQRLTPLRIRGYDAYTLAAPPPTLALRGILEPPDRVRAWLVEERAGLPSAGGSLARARDRAAIASQNGDLSIVSRSTMF